MDLLDKRILIILDRNCRTTYRSISEQVGITANAVKKRIESMIADGTIVKFNIMPTLAMGDLSFYFGIIETSSKEDPLKFMDDVSETEIVAHISQLAYGEGGGYSIFGQYRNSESLASSLNIIRSMECVRKLEFHNGVTFTGKKITLNSLQKRILRVMVKDPRMSISQIASETGLSARRVRKELDMLIGSEAFHFGVRWNLAAGQNNHVLIYTRYSQDMVLDEFYEWLYEKYELEAWATSPSAVEPLLVTQIVTVSLLRIPEIISSIEEYPGVEEVRDYVVYRTKKFPWPADRIMQEIIE